jgi:hypothetical protein
MRRGLITGDLLMLVSPRYSGRNESMSAAIIASCAEACSTEEILAACRVPKFRYGLVFAGCNQRASITVQIRRTAARSTRLMPT